MSKSIKLALGLILIAISSPLANAEEIVKCPEYSAPVNASPIEIPDATALSFNGQYLQRIDPETRQINKNLKGVVGCYRYFSKNIGVDAKWDVGVVTFLNNDYYWLNAAGSKWKLTPDFENLIFETDSSNPYFASAKEFAITSPTSLAKLPTGECKMKNRSGTLGLGFPIPVRRISQEKSPKVLAVLIDFKTKIADDMRSEMNRLRLDLVEDFYSDNSLGNSKLEIIQNNEVIYVQGNPEDYTASNGNYSLLTEAFELLKKSTDISRYSGYIFLTSQNGPEFSSGYAGMLGGLTQIASDHSIPFIWMGGKDAQNTSWVALWKMVAHEVGHMYGLPDLYMTQASNSEGKTVGPFDLMDGITGKANSLNFMHRWMLGWLSSSQIKCHLPVDNPVSYQLSPVAIGNSGTKGIIIPISGVEALLVEARVASKYDSLLPSQEGIVVYFMDTRKPSGTGPLRLIPSVNPFTMNKSFMDDVDRFLEGALRVGDLVTESGITVHVNSRSLNDFEVTIAKGEDYLKTVEAKRAADEKIIQDKLAADKLELERIAAEQRALSQKKLMKTITCSKGKALKKISGTNPKCPSGYKIKK